MFMKLTNILTPESLIPRSPVLTYSIINSMFNSFETLVKSGLPEVCDIFLKPLLYRKIEQGFLFCRKGGAIS